MVALRARDFNPSAQTHRHCRLPFVAVATLLGFCCLALTARPSRAQEPAARADDFVERVGVATHWGYSDTPYGMEYEKVRALLAASGIRHVRDGFHPRLLDLYAKHGIRATVIFNPGDAAQVVETVKANRPLIAMVEGPNEVNLFAQSAAYHGQGFPEGPRAWMNDLYRALKADPATAPVPVIAPSTAAADANARLAPLSAFDHTVMHSYAGGQMPSRSLTGEINNNVSGAYQILGPGSVLKPIVVTESGYHTALGSSVVLAGAQPGVSEKAQAKYLPRHFAEYFNAGIVRTFTYEFVDEFPDYENDERRATNAEACFGIVKRDLTPKPAYTALKRLLGLLGEARWDPAGKSWVRPAPAFRPGALSFTLSGDTKNVHHTLLQKANGDFYLLLWQEVSSFDTTKRENVTNADARVTLSLAGRAANVAVYRPFASSDPVQTSDAATKTLALFVPDDVLVVRLTPGGALPARTPPPAPPSGLSAVTTNASAVLSWRPEVGRNKPEGFFVYRMGAFVGRVTGTTTFRDPDRLLPGAGYAYQVAAYDAAGRVSPRASVVAQTKNEFPDLVVTDISWTVGSARAGKPLTLRATIVNKGSAPTPAGIVHGVAFSVGGRPGVLCWSDTFSGPLAPGEARTVTANNGPSGNKTWTPDASGSYRLSATVDDVHRIPESDDTNNTLEKTVTVP